MAIVLSEIVADDAYADGRRTIVEHHTDDKGVVHPNRTIGVPANTDATAEMLARVPFMEEQLAEAVVAQKFADDEDAAEAKLDAYVGRLSDADAKRLIGFSDDELKVVRE